jgi:glycosyltransferase involved in cell wall biosynthesis
VTDVVVRGDPDVVLDCRWLDFWGAGRVTELLLRGLAEDPPDGRWLLWGPTKVESFAWPAAAVRRSGRDPRAWRGQRARFETPPGRVVVFLHQQRPLQRRASVVVIYDTIQLRYGGSRAVRMLRTSYLRRSAALADSVVTISQYSRECICRDLRVPADRVHVLALPIDHARADRVADRRRTSTIRDLALYVGRFAPHKNLGRLVAAFERTRFCAEGGRLLLTGGRGEEVAELGGGLSQRQRDFVDVRPWCSQAELEELMATCRFLVQPSLEEGFGLPVVEAMAGGVTVCVSDGGSLPEVTKGLVVPFAAQSVPAMAAALDEAAVNSRDRGREEHVAHEIRRLSPDPAQYARQFRVIIDKALARC